MVFNNALVNRAQDVRIASLIKRIFYVENIRRSDAYSRPVGGGDAPITISK